MNKLWAGRFSKQEDERVNDFNSSIAFDARMAQHDIQGSIAHATMLGRQGIIEPAEAELIVQGLEGIARDLQTGALAIDPTAEDIHMFVASACIQPAAATTRSPWISACICGINAKRSMRSCSATSMR